MIHATSVPALALVRGRFDRCRGLQIAKRSARSEPRDTASARQACPIECEPGGFAVIDRSRIRIAAVLRSGRGFRFDRIRQRQTAPRIAWDGRPTVSETAIRSAVESARARSVCVGEICRARRNPKTDEA
jgi:hypothetical protein